MPKNLSSGLRVRPHSFATSLSYASLPVAVQPVQQPRGVLRCAPGPWGKIEYHFIYLEAAEQVVARFRSPGTMTQWSFPGATVAQLAAFFEAADMWRRSGGENQRAVSDADRHRCFFAVNSGRWVV